MPMGQVFGHFYWLWKLSENTEALGRLPVSRNIQPIRTRHICVYVMRREEEMKNVIKKVFSAKSFVMS